jgi:hypothetical protein
MRSSLLASLSPAFVVVALGASSALAGSVGSAVLDYDSGTLPGTLTGYTVQSAALGAPEADTGFGALTPFNPPFLTSQVLGAGSNGHFTVKLNAPIIVNSSARIGVFGNTGIVDQDPDTVYQNEPPFATLAGAGGYTGASGELLSFGGGLAKVSVSNDNVNWISLSPDPIIFNNPTNAWIDNQITLGLADAGTTRADYFKAFSGSLADTEGLWYRKDTDASDLLRVLDGSAGGTWLDVSSVNLPSIEYVKFEVPEGGRFVLDAVTAVPEPGAMAVLGLLGAALLRRRR